MFMGLSDTLRTTRTPAFSSTAMIVSFASVGMFFCDSVTSVCNASRRVSLSSDSASRHSGATTAGLAMAPSARTHSGSVRVSRPIMRRIGSTADGSPAFPSASTARSRTHQSSSSSASISVGTARLSGTAFRISMA
jgi:hypothetical protein